MELSKNHYEFGLCSYVKWKRNNSKFNLTFERFGWWKIRGTFYHYSRKHKSFQSNSYVIHSECVSKRTSVWDPCFCNRFKSLGKRNNCKKLWIDGNHSWSLTTYDKSRKTYKVGSFNIEQHIKRYEWKIIDKGILNRVGDDWFFRWFFGRYCSKYFGWYFNYLIDSNSFLFIMKFLDWINNKKIWVLMVSFSNTKNLMTIWIFSIHSDISINFFIFQRSHQ